MLGVVGCCLDIILQENAISVVKMKELVRDTYERIGDAIEYWPGTDTGKDGHWVFSRAKEWDKTLVRKAKDFCRLPMLAATASNCFADLDELTKDREKRELLEGIKEPLDKILKFCDPHGINFPAYEGADLLLKKLYELIELKR